MLPYGVFKTESGERRLAVAIGPDLIDLAAASDQLADAVDPRMLRSGRLNEVLAAGRSGWSALRAALIERVVSGQLDEYRLAQSDVSMQLAWDVGDFVDFYSSRYHAENVGRMFRPGSEPLLPNWRHLPVAYHGRSGTVFVDGTPVSRPSGQRKKRDGQVVFGPSTRLDIEAELGWVVGGATRPGEAVLTEDAGEHLFGLVILNDWSARDIQAWEYQPLGPFLGKSFASSVSAWVAPVDALTSARLPNPPQTDPIPLEYLRIEDPWTFDIELEVWLTPADAEEPARIARMNTAESLYWNAAQQLAHMTVNGATIRPGDLFGSGTVSGPSPDQRGSLLELSWNASEPIDTGNGTTRTFLEDGDHVTITATFPGTTQRLPLGPVSGRIHP